MSSSPAALAYHEPGIITILILASFLLLENAINWAFDKLLFCGLLGQIAVGVAWGTPGAKWLSIDVENTIMQIGYLGLILLVFEGGLAADLKTLRSYLSLSSIVALIGISAPIGLSFLLQSFMEITPVQSFAAGAALCSTSLGTTFTILSTSGLSQSRLGVVLSSAAMMDDLVGLVMSSIISSLGRHSDFSATTVIRPVFVSVAFAAVLPLICLYIVKPMTRQTYKLIKSKRGTQFHRLLTTESAALVLHALVLAALVTASSYAGTSVLFAAYLAGAAISWWDGLCFELRNADAQNTLEPVDGTDLVGSSQNGESSGAMDSKAHSMPQKPRAHRKQSGENNTSSSPKPREPQQPVPTPSTRQAVPSYDHLRGTHIFEKYYLPALQTVLKPFFFASIGFAIPITQMFSGTVVWRGIVYSIIMVIAKLFCGLCLIRVAGPAVSLKFLLKHLPKTISGCWPLIRTQSKTPGTSSTRGGPRSQSTTTVATAAPKQRSSPRIAKPTSLYPAAMLGSAMVARGEIGFLICSVAESDGVFGATENGQSSELFLVVTWAILLCTLLGPIAVGLMVKRVKRLQELERSIQTGKEDPLGIWGVIPSQAASH
ncbi:uncharacterized protein CLAFUR5_04250 [Fulvia fulva]|uniref:Cation/H+ exchanger transmembrane domain-containing protein n=1 Tax=Passalora fulva TaxID=5499 RepID=A0A9Q8LEL8_PASFU|nr:uncharacterized protein CLAFUR5_04250 [Fulvia fulva]KAK4627694.1 hypothetical protein CLAFUR0_04273 [Fulvia fulva]UJO15972.1 hypothetical protein CLAFUR5_04250 [Fulvia fulva]WPV28314.1 hypothetical protein CLAFUW7_04274 [Fulvia fulva]